MSDERFRSDEQWEGAPLPDLDAAWQKMDALLDKEKRRRRVVPLWFRRTAALSVLLGLVLGAGWWLRSGGKEKQITKASSATEVKANGAVKKDLRPTKNSQQSAPVDFISKPTAEEDTAVQSSGFLHEKNGANLVIPSVDKLTSTPQRRPRQSKNSVAAVQKHERQQRPQADKTKPEKTAVASLPLKPESGTDNDEANKPEPRKKEATTAGSLENKEEDSLQTSDLPKKDSAARTDSIKATVPSVVVTQQNKKPSKRSAFIVSAGVGMQQAIATQRQPSSPPDSFRRKRVFFDYFPSVYVKVERGRWAVQAEFQYSAPQPVENISFAQKTSYDAINFTLNTEQTTLRRLYYHQLPVSINYRVAPQLSVGAGASYNILAGAVTEQNMINKNPVTGSQTTMTTRVPVRGYTDSFLYKTTVGLLLQTELRWKRLSAGLRYTQPLQPFIRYTAPDGRVTNERTAALQALLRFQLWKARRPASGK